jgi:predicted nuclease of predicted toxin-antitoxin system
MKILIDMNLSPDWVEVFTAAKIESIHWLSVGDPAAKDTVLMAYARMNDSELTTGALVTIDSSRLRVRILPIVRQ